ncbi:hypothetical protein [Nonomuraea diastatica]|uniref:Uncharacterized protein n=1 Tax=Nonomuraea diastatica TaxID=1848329 RepID=A0A4R4W9G0_9ACTN|nr:hypothetical protein [Nonomuraea diastatica]TDD12424.1 hypothetical protein E1294_43655 [Nonomuraea diastatica]
MRAEFKGVRAELSAAQRIATDAEIALAVATTDLEAAERGKQERSQRVASAEQEAQRPRPSDADR